MNETPKMPRALTILLKLVDEAEKEVNEKKR